MQERGRPVCGVSGTRVIFSETQPDGSVVGVDADYCRVAEAAVPGDADAEEFVSLILGSCDMDDAKFDQWCPKFGIVGVSVEYRLAPEWTYPVPLEDCYAGLKWTFDHADEIGVDGDRIGISGVSVGGGLCAALAILARDQGEVPVRFQMLDCPMIDDRQATPSSRLDDLIIWTRGSNGELQDDG